MKNYRVRNAKKKNYIIRLNDVYDMVAASLAAETKDRSAKRIREALICCLLALRKDGHWFNRPIAKAAIQTIQNKIEKYPVIQ